MTVSSVLKIAVPLAGKKFSTHFGHSDGFALFEVDTTGRQIIGRQDLSLQGQSGCGSAPFLRENGASVLIVGGIGPGAIANLQAANIAVCAADDRRDPEALVRGYLDGTLIAANANCDHGHEHGHAHGHGHEHGHAHGHGHGHGHGDSCRCQSQRHGQ